MAKVTFFIGLCGSGKSHESKELEKQYLKREQKVKMFQEIIGREQIPELIQTLKDGIDCIVEEALYCDPIHRNKIQQRLEQVVPEADIQWECFENNLKAANWNVKNRSYDDAEVALLIEKERLRLIKLNTEILHPIFDSGDITVKTIFQIPPN